MKSQIFKRAWYLYKFCGSASFKSALKKAWTWYFDDVVSVQNQAKIKWGTIPTNLGGFGTKGD